MGHMAEITIETVDNLARLARLEVPEAEKAKLVADLSAIVGYFAELKNAPGAGHLAEDYQLKNVMREDTDPYTSGEYTEDLLKAAPARHGDYFEVKKIM